MNEESQNFERFIGVLAAQVDARSCQDCPLVGKGTLCPTHVRGWPKRPCRLARSYHELHDVLVDIYDQMGAER
jgi:hypothetical protein